MVKDDIIKHLINIENSADELRLLIDGELSKNGLDVSKDWLQIARLITDMSREVDRVAVKAFYLISEENKEI